MIREANLHWQYQDTETNLIMPWYTLPALEWLKKQETYKWYVLEFGAGYSTMWWNSNSRFNFAIEHNKSWALIAGQNCFYRNDKNDYINSAQFIIDEVSTDDNSFDCIIIDGEWRYECASMSMELIKPGGYMIVDNYGQTDFPSAEIIDALLEGWEKQIFRQPNHSDWCTAVFKKP